MADYDYDPEEAASLLKLAQELKEKRSAGILGGKVEEKPKFDADLVPEVPKRELSDEELQLDSALQTFDIVEAYRRFIGKMEPKYGPNQRESIKVSCPIPGHVDKDPSAWCNLDDNVWYCAKCDVGGDIFDFGAIHFGYNLDTYKRDGSFPKLKQQMAERLGFATTRSVTGRKFIIAPPTPYDDPTEGPEEEPDEESPSATVTQLHVVEPPEEEDDDDDILKNPDLFIDWEKVFPEETFGTSYMVETTIDDLPPEYYFAQAMQALGFALGHNTYMADYKAVRANFYVCLYGRTGVGKSRSIYPFLELLHQGLPFDDSDQFANPTGVKIVPVPNSAEALMDSFKHEIKDPSTMQTVDLGRISGLVKIEELSSFIAKASRQGSALRETIMDMYDIFGYDITSHARSSGRTVIRDPLVQFLTTTQPKAIHAYLRRTDIETGFLNRWWFVSGRSRRAPISYGGRSPDLTDPVEKLKNVAQWAASGKRMVLDGAALDVWDNFFHDKIAPFRTGEVEMESIASRIDLQLKKAIVALTGNSLLNHPTPEIVQRAISLYEFLQITYSGFSKDIAFNDVTECQNKIIDIIDSWYKKNNVFPTGREIRQRVGKKYDAEMMIRALKNLVQLDVVFEEIPKVMKRGRPSKHYGLYSLKAAKTP